MFALSAYCGLRAGEVLGRRAEDVDPEQAVLTIRQTAWYGKLQSAKSEESETTEPIPAPLGEMLKPLVGRPGLLFVFRRGRSYTAEKVAQKLWPLCDGLGIPRAGFHAFRHLHTSLILHAGATPKAVRSYCCLLLPRGSHKSWKVNGKIGRGGGDRIQHPRPVVQPDGDFRIAVPRLPLRNPRHGCKPTKSPHPRAL